MNNTWNINLFLYFLWTIFNNSLNLVKFVRDVMQITHQHLPGWLFNVCITRLQTRRGLPVGGRGLLRPMRERCVLPWAWPPGRERCSSWNCNTRASLCEFVDRSCRPESSPVSVETFSRRPQLKTPITVCNTQHPRALSANVTYCGSNLWSFSLN